MRIYTFILILIPILFGCKSSKTFDQTNNDTLLSVEDTCGLYKILLSTNFPYSYLDTIRIPFNYKKVTTDSTIKYFINKEHNTLYNHSFLRVRNNFVFSLIEDEGEIVTINVYLINGCKLTNDQVIAQTSQWEHGKKNMFTIFFNDTTFKTFTFSQSRDWGDYTQWKYDTLISCHVINRQGKILKN